MQRGHSEHGHVAFGVSLGSHPARFVHHWPAGEPGCGDVDVMGCFAPFLPERMPSWWDGERH